MAPRSRTKMYHVPAASRTVRANPSTIVFLSPTVSSCPNHIVRQRPYYQQYLCSLSSTVSPVLMPAIASVRIHNRDEHFSRASERDSARVTSTFSQSSVTSSLQSKLSPVSKVSTRPQSTVNPSKTSSRTKSESSALPAASTTEISTGPGEHYLSQEVRERTIFPSPNRDECRCSG